MSRASCLICGGPLQQPATGRPAVYCGGSCKRAGRLERERLQRRIEHLETGLASLCRLGPGVTTPAYLASVEADIEQAQGRLLGLLGRPEGHLSGGPSADRR
jgi:hypothetical protein